MNEVDEEMEAIYAAKRAYSAELNKVPPGKLAEYINRRADAIIRDMGRPIRRPVWYHPYASKEMDS
jgi:hypothetical protein